MGRSVARLLASKGANVLLVARGVEKLKDAVGYVSVKPSGAPVGHWFWNLIHSAGSCKTRNAEISLYQCRPQKSFWRDAHNRRSHNMEWRQTTWYSVELCRCIYSRPLHWDASWNLPRSNGHQLYGQCVHRPCSSSILACSRSRNKHGLAFPWTSSYRLHVIDRSVLSPCRLLSLYVSQNGPTFSIGHPFPRAPTILFNPYAHQNPYRLSRHHPHSGLWGREQNQAWCDLETWGVGQWADARRGSDRECERPGERGRTSDDKWDPRLPHESGNVRFQQEKWVGHCRHNGKLDS